MGLRPMVLIVLTWKSDLLVGNLRRRLPQPSHWKSQFVIVAFPKSQGRNLHWRKVNLLLLFFQNHTGEFQTGEKSGCYSCILKITLEKNDTGESYTGEKSVSKSCFLKMFGFVAHLSQVRLSAVVQAIRPLVERRAGRTKATSTWRTLMWWW